MKKNYLLFLLLSTLTVFGQSGVGINKTTPQQQLHLGSATGTIRVDGLNSTNNEFNGGVAGQTYPLYVNNNGDMTLQVSATENSNGGDAYTTAGINGTVAITGAQANDGYEVVEMTTYTFNVTRNTVLEIKYSLSIEVFKDNTLAIIQDPYARNITNFFTLDTPTLTATTRRYAAHSKCYFNFNNPDLKGSGAVDPGKPNLAPPNASTGYIYNSGTTYMYLTPGSHTIRFYGSVTSGTNNQNTYVRFAGGPDSIFMRLY